MRMHHQHYSTLALQCGTHMCLLRFVFFSSFFFSILFSRHLIQIQTFRHKRIFIAFSKWCFILISNNIILQKTITSRMFFSSLLWIFIAVQRTAMKCVLRAVRICRLADSFEMGTFVALKCESVLVFYCWMNLFSDFVMWILDLKK